MELNFEHTWVSHEPMRQNFIIQCEKAGSILDVRSKDLFGYLPLDDFELLHWEGGSIPEHVLMHLWRQHNKRGSVLEQK